ncbi:MAG: hypothetical protein N3D16_07785 [Anaerolineales bacterium]|nr:hypothetical protein [Anaerolineales bacterium]
MDDQTFIEYLHVKKSIDDRSLNRAVWDALVASMPPSSCDQPWQVLEIGSGIATMIQRLVDWDFLHYAHYVALDVSTTILGEGWHWLNNWAHQRGFEALRGDHTLRIVDRDHEIWVDFVAEDLNGWLTTSSPEGVYDLLIAHAFLDLINLEETLPKVLCCLKKGGLFYFTINFDGLTVFEPPCEEALDEKILSLYHRTMEMRMVGGKLSAGAFSGRRLLRAVKQAGGELLRAGASDWVVHSVEGKYPPGEDRFLRFLLQMIEEALKCSSEIEESQLRAWIEYRKAQIERGDLILITHQLDLLGRRKGTP